MTQEYLKLIETINKLVMNLGYDFTSKTRKIKTEDGWIEVKNKNITTMMWYNHFVKSGTFSLPIHNPTMSNVLIFDIDDKQPNGLPVKKVVEQIVSDFDFFYIENKTTGKGAHLYCYCESPIYTDGKKYLVKHYKAKGMTVETEWSHLRLPYSIDYRNRAVDGNGQKIESLAHLEAVFSTKDSVPSKIPSFLKPFNKPGSVIQKYSDQNSTGLSIDDIIISRGARSDNMVTLALYAIGKNMTLDEYSELCYSKEDSSNPSKGLHDLNSDRTIESIYNWAENNFDKEFMSNERSQKIKEFLNESELELSNENFENISYILKRNGCLAHIKYDKVKERTIHSVQSMMEGILSMQDYHENNPSGSYKGKHAILNSGLAIAQSTVKLIAEYYGIKNWKQIWKIVKEVFLKPIQLANGFYYSYCNVRHAIHYKLVSITSLFNSLIKKLYNKKSFRLNTIYYNICSQVSNNINSNISKIFKINEYQIRPGPL